MDSAELLAIIEKQRAELAEARAELRKYLRQDRDERRPPDLKLLARDLPTDPRELAAALRPHVTPRPWTADVDDPSTLRRARELAPGWTGKVWGGGDRVTSLGPLGHEPRVTVDDVPVDYAYAIALVNMADEGAER